MKKIIVSVALRLNHIGIKVNLSGTKPVVVSVALRLNHIGM